MYRVIVNGCSDDTLLFPSEWQAYKFALKMLNVEFGLNIDVVAA